MNHLVPQNISEYFETIKRYHDIILFGCGGKGREAIPILKEHGITITAACDNNAALWGQKFAEGIRIQEFEQAISDLADCCVIITTTMPYAMDIYHDIIKKHHNMPIYHMCSPFKVEECLLAEREAEAQEKELLESYGSLQDEESRKIFMDTLHWKMTGNMFPLRQYSLGNPDYSFFDEDLIHTDEHSVYVDVGAYTGDTIECFLMFSKGKFKKVIGVEADEGNYNALAQFVQYSRVERIETHNLALWSQEEKKVFYTNSDNDAIHIDNSNLFRSIDVMVNNLSLSKVRDKMEESILNVTTLDNLLKNDVPTIIKINALAADREIILGGRQIIREHRPALILEFGVAKRDVFEMIPLLKQLNEQYKFYMRRKKVFGDMKTVLYCI